MVHNQTVTLNSLPAPTWNWLHINSTEAKVSQTESGCENTLKVLNGGIENGSAEAIEHSALGDSLSELWNPAELKAFNTSGNCALLINCISSEKATGERYQFNVSSESLLTVYMVYSSTIDQIQGQFSIQTYFNIGKDAKVKLVQLSLLSEHTALFNDVIADCADRASFESVQCFFGSSHTYAANLANLKGDSSSCKLAVAYYGYNSKTLDFNYEVPQFGKKTSSLIEVHGVLDDQSRKVFRGTIDFKTGSSGSVGTETENVLLLGEDSVNKTIPLILCSEEDVKGNHGATIGNLDPEQVFYLSSRGLNQSEIRQLMIKAKFDTVIHEIRNEDLQEIAENYISEVIK